MMNTKIECVAPRFTRCDIEIIKSAHGLSSYDDVASLLIDFARTTVWRLAGMADTCGRILGGGVSNRLKGRLEPIQSILAALPCSLGMKPSTSSDLSITKHQIRSTKAEKLVKAPSCPTQGLHVAALVLKQVGLTLAEIRSEVGQLVAESKQLVHGRSLYFCPRALDL